MSADAPLDDDAYLDELFERMSDAVAEGRPVDPAAWVVDRPHLLEEAEACLRTARATSMGRTRETRTLAGYAILGELGSGAMGDVYLAEREALGGHPVALKVLPASVRHANGARERFLLEARALARVRHPNIVAIHDVVETEDCLAYAMEWIDGAPLSKIVRGRKARAAGTPSPDDAAGDDPETLPDAQWVPFVCRAGAGLARALEAMHAAGLLHRDVKPSNVLVDRAGTAHLADFGLVHDEEHSMQTQTGAFLGTLAYAAPEQLRGARADARSDVYGLGATLYQALTGELPHEASNPGALLHSIENDRLVPAAKRNPRLPRDLCVVVEKALERDPAARYASASALADDLDRVLALQPIHARPASAGERFAKLLRRNRRAARVGLVTALVALVVGTFAVVRTWERARLPQLYATHVRDARLALLGDDLQDRALIAVLSRGGARDAADELAALDRALSLYRSALALDDRDPEIVDEAEVVALARAVAAGEKGPRPPSDAFARRCPTAVEAFAAAADGRAHRYPVARLLDDADRRATGLFAYLRGATDVAIDYLGPFGLREQPDPLVEGLLGQVHLFTHRTGLAYPRLFRASEEIPESGSLAVAAAIAAIAEDDLDVGRRLLERAESSPLPAREHELALARCDLAVAEGADLEDLRSTYAAHASTYWLARWRLGSVDERLGAPDRALRAYLDTLRAYPSPAEHAAAVRRTAEAWWAPLAEGERRVRLLAALDGELEAFGSLLDLAAAVHGDGPTTSDSFARVAAHVAASGLEPTALVALPGERKRELAQRWCDPESREPGPDDAALTSLLADFSERMDRRDTVRGALSPTAVWAAAAGRDAYGTALGVLGDLTGDGAPELLVASATADTNGRDAGTVDVVDASTGEVLRSAHGERAFDRFGASVAALDDLDGDGLPEWVGLAPQFEIAGAGYARVESGRGEALLVVDGPAEGAGLTVVAAVGDLDGDARSDFALGAPRVGGTNVGRVVVHASADGDKLRVWNGERADDGLGQCVVGMGDADLDGWPDVAISAGSIATHGAGRVEVFSGRTGEALHRLVPEPWTLHFGTALAPAGDLDADGHPDLLVGAAHPSTADTRPGSAFAISGRDGRTLLELQGARSGGGFGVALSPVGDLSGDGLPDLAVTEWNPYRPYEPALCFHASSGEFLARLGGAARVVTLPTAPDARELELVTSGAAALERWSFAPRVPEPAAVRASPGRRPLFRPLHLAVESDDLDRVRALLEQGESPDEPAAYGLTPLHVAVLLGRGEAVSILLEHGADPTRETDLGFDARELARRDPYERGASALAERLSAPD